LLPLDGANAVDARGVRLRGGDEALRYRALSKAVPVLPIEGRCRPLRGACRTRSPSTGRRDRNDARVGPADGLRLHTAIWRASATSSVFMWESMDQPTTLREWASKVKARSRRPSCVGRTRYPPARPCFGLSGHEAPAEQIRGGSSLWVTAGGSAPLAAHATLNPAARTSPAILRRPRTQGAQPDVRSRGLLAGSRRSRGSCGEPRGSSRRGQRPRGSSWKAAWRARCRVAALGGPEHPAYCCHRVAGLLLRSMSPKALTDL